MKIIFFFFFLLHQKLNTEEERRRDDRKKRFQENSEKNDLKREGNNIFSVGGKMPSLINNFYFLI